MHAFRKPRFLWVYPLAVLLVTTAHATERSLRVGILLALLGETLRCWANGYVGHVKVNWTQTWRHDPPIGRLITAGPYAYVRHPLYLGTFLIGLGFCMTAQRLSVALGALAFFLIVYPRKAQAEEAILLHERGAAYQDYQRAVPRWLPAVRRYPDRQGQWSWRGIRASRELKTLAWVVVGLLAIYFREAYWQERALFTSKTWLKHTLLLVVCALLIVTDGIVELIRRASPPRSEGALIDRQNT